MKKMALHLNKDFIAICEDIEREHMTQEKWAEIESDDMFQEGNFCGGFDAIEMEFTFSYYDELEKEWWFQLSLDQVQQIANGQEVVKILRPSE